MRISISTIGNFIPADFSLTPIIANEFIPLIALTRRDSREGFFYYSKPSFTKFIRKPNTLKNIKDGFEMSQSTKRIEINGRVFFIARGVFFSELGVPLMVCAMKKEAYLNSSVSKFSDYDAKTFSYNNYVLFYSTSFFTDPGLTPLNRRLQKEILQSCYEKGIEVRVISSLEIEKNTFARLFEVKKTKSLTQLEAYMEQVLPNFLHNGGEDTFVEQEFEPRVLAHEEELSVEEEAMLFYNEEQVELLPIFNQTSTTTVPWEIPAQTIADARELAELEAEAATFSHPLEPEIDWATVEAALDTEESAHTGSERSVTMVTNQAGMEMFQQALRAEVNTQLTMPAINHEEVRQSMAHPAESLVERIRPLQDVYNREMLQAHYVAGVDPYTSDINSVQVGRVTWRTARREGQIELIDDTE